MQNVTSDLINYYLSQLLENRTKLQTHKMHEQYETDLMSNKKKEALNSYLSTFIQQE